MTKIYISIIVFSMILIVACNPVEKEIPRKKEIVVHLGPNVRCANSNPEKKILDKWEFFLKNESYYEWESEDLQWSERMPYPLLPLRDVINKDVLKHHHINILGIYPIDSNLYCIKNSLIYNKQDTLYPAYQFSVFANLYDGNIKFMSNPQIVKMEWQHQKIGNIDYYFDWHDHLNMKDAIYFNNFNTEIAEKFELAPIKFDYFQCKYSRNVFDVQGFDLSPAKYFSKQTGGMADPNNNIIYAGNGKAIYTHELIHLYSMKKWNDTHFWFEEGLATFLGGSMELPLEWHLTELLKFSKKYPEYEFSNIDTLHYFQNDSFDLKFKYNIGGLIIKEIINKHGFEYLNHVMGQGRETEDFYSILEKSLDIKKENMDEWVRDKISFFEE